MYVCMFGFFCLFYCRILLKICTQLKSRAKETRDMARDTLVKLAQSLGPSYVPYIVKDMKETLTKGYQVSMYTCTCVGPYANV